jgi:aminoglycoside 6'-N-acetyltransferase I
MEKFDSIEKPSIIAEVTNENADNLVALRQTINKDKSLEKLQAEAEKYVEGKDRKAFLSMQGEVATGFVEVKSEEAELPDGAPEMLGLDGLAHLERIAVAEKFRGQGIAKELLSKAEEWAKQQGRKGIWLDCLVENVAAGKLYESAGYRDAVEFTDPKKGKQRKIVAKYFE